MFDTGLAIGNFTFGVQGQEVTTLKLLHTFLIMKKRDSSYYQKSTSTRSVDYHCTSLLSYFYINDMYVCMY